MPDNRTPTEIIRMPDSRTKKFLKIIKNHLNYWGFYCRWSSILSATLVQTIILFEWIWLRNGNQCRAWL